MPGGALREYPGRDSNPQCPRGRTAFKAADFASLSTRAMVSASYAGAQEPRPDAEYGSGGSPSFVHIASRTEPSARPAPRGPLARVDLRVRAAAGPGVGHRGAAAARRPRGDVRDLGPRAGDRPPSRA